MKKILVENYLQFLYTDKRVDAKEWQGPNIPYGDDSNRPNLIRQCMTLESDKMKINCLRKLRDQVAMNPFYQARLDRFVDAVTGIYEPTNEPGTIPGNEFKAPPSFSESKKKILESFLRPDIEKTKLNINGTFCIDPFIASYKKDGDDWQIISFYDIKGLSSPYTVYAINLTKDIRDVEIDEVISLDKPNYTSDSEITKKWYIRSKGACGKLTGSGLKKIQNRKLLPNKTLISFTFSTSALPGKWELTFMDDWRGSLKRIS